MVAVEVGKMLRKSPLRGHLDAWIKAGTYYAGRGHGGRGDMKAASQGAISRFMAKVVSPAVKMWVKAHGLRGNKWQHVDNAVGRIISREYGMKPMMASINEARSSKALDAFMKAWWGRTHPNPIDPAERILGFKPQNWITMKLRPFDGRIHISWMQVFPGSDRKGVATKALKIMTDLADKHGVGMSLSAKPTGEPKISMSKLKGLYSKFGFKTDYGDFMVREPR